MPPHSPLFRHYNDLLDYRATHQGSQIAYSYLEDGENITASVTYREFASQVKDVAVELKRYANPGDRVVLLYPSGIDYMVAFFACLYAGLIAVPAFPPRNSKHNARLVAIVKDSGARIALTTQAQLRQMETGIAASEELAALRFLCNDAVPQGGGTGCASADISAETIAFLQYTSGSTGQPKGVMVTHANLIYNQRMLRVGFATHEGATLVTWLPIYHDMGLIGKMLHAFWLGGHCVVMSPIAFLQRPVRWLKAISRFKAHCSGGPNFAYDLCCDKISAEQKAELDLSSWHTAFNGAEPVRRHTLERFSQAFAMTGFKHEALLPCYGMAETTLIVSGRSPTPGPVYRHLDPAAFGTGRAIRSDGADAYAIVGCGHSLLDQAIRIANPHTLAACRPGEVGEIWVAGPHVASGYWEKPETNAATFGAHLSDTGEGPFLRTGDLGYLDGGELYVSGRLKDVLIVRGVNKYPQDIEATVENADTAINTAGVAAFMVDDGREERVVVVAEVTRAGIRKADPQTVTAGIRRLVLETHEVVLSDVVLIRPATLPKTSSGKVQRAQARALYLADQLSRIDREVATADTPGD